MPIEAIITLTLLVGMGLVFRWLLTDPAPRPQEPDRSHWGGT
jgi:hypothetical protein